LDPSCAVLLEPWRAVWIDVAKVASSSLKAVFAGLLGLDLDAVGGNPHALAYPHPPEAEREGARLFPGRYAFAFVRNPWDRLVSCWRDKIGGEVREFTGMAPRGVAWCLASYDVFHAGMPFEAFVRAVAEIPDDDADEHFRSQHCNLVNARGDLAVDFVGRYEALEADFRGVAETIGLPPDVTLPCLQANPVAVDHAAFYTAQTRDLVATRYARDVALFGYAFG
jgi:hypothetical protein